MIQLFAAQINNNNNNNNKKDNTCNIVGTCSRRVHHQAVICVRQTYCREPMPRSQIAPLIPPPQLRDWLQNISSFNFMSREHISFRVTHSKFISWDDFTIVTNTWSLLGTVSTPLFLFAIVSIHPPVVKRIMNLKDQEDDCPSFLFFSISFFF